LKWPTSDKAEPGISAGFKEKSGASYCGQHGRQRGVRVNLIGLCQGGWMAAVVAARFPHQVNGLASPARPIDTDAGLADFSNFLQVPGTS
jgi:hypothetical protein